MAFPVPLASALSGATIAQLAYWRRSTPSDEPLLVPAASKGGRFLYSWADVVALRTIVFLRQEKSLPKIRRAVRTLAELEAGEWEHLANYRLVSTPKTIVVRHRDGTLMDLEFKPGAILDEILMADVLEPFDTADGRTVPSLPRPRPQLSVDPGVLGGYPVVRGTRVPYDVVAGLVEDGYTEAEIIEIYPSVRRNSVADAAEFAREIPHAA